MKFGEILQPWLARKEATVKPSTYAVYTCAVQQFLMKKFGAIELDGIDEDVVQEWIGEMASSGLSYRTCKDRVVALKNALRFAEKKGWRKSGIRMDVVFPRRFSEEDERRELALTKETCDAIVNAVDKELECPSWRNINVNNRVGVVISLFTGLRIGEVCGLKWEDIDLDEGVIRVRRTVQTNYIYAQDGTGSSKLYVGSPKSRTSRRDVPICAPLRERLERLDRPADGTAYFLTGTQSPTVPRTLRSSVDLFLARHGIENFNFHRLRHTFATRCIEAGVDAKTTSELLGHANVNITLNLYVHPNAGAKRAAVDRMAAAFGVQDGKNYTIYVNEEVKP